MEKATVTSKGQITLPSSIRERLNIEAGDKLLFDIEGEELRVRFLRNTSVASLFAALPGVDAYAGIDAEQQAAREGFGNEP